MMLNASRGGSSAGSTHPGVPHAVPRQKRDILREGHTSHAVRLGALRDGECRGAARAAHHRGPLLPGGENGRDEAQRDFATTRKLERYALNSAGVVSSAGFFANLPMTAAPRSSRAGASAASRTAQPFARFHHGAFGFDYSKWDKLELSDDEDDHPGAKFIEENTLRRIKRESHERQEAERARSACRRSSKQIKKDKKRVKELLLAAGGPDAGADDAAEISPAQRRDRGVRVVVARQGGERAQVQRGRDVPRCERAASWAPRASRRGRREPRLRVVRQEVRSAAGRRGGAWATITATWLSFFKNNVHAPHRRLRRVRPPQVPLRGDGGRQSRDASRRARRLRPQVHQRFRRSRPEANERAKRGPSSPGSRMSPECARNTTRRSRTTAGTTHRARGCAHRGGGGRAAARQAGGGGRRTEEPGRRSRGRAVGSGWTRPG